MSQNNYSCGLGRIHVVLPTLPTKIWGSQRQT